MYFHDWSERSTTVFQSKGDHDRVPLSMPSLGRITLLVCKNSNPSSRTVGHCVSSSFRWQKATMGQICLGRDTQASKTLTMLKYEKAICSRSLWFGLSNWKSHPFPEPTTFRPWSFVKLSQVSWLTVLGFLAVERSCIQKSSALGLFGFHRAIKRATESLWCCSRLLCENE